MFRGKLTVAALSLLATVECLAAPGSRIAVPVASMVSTGAVRVGDEVAPSRATIFEGDVVKTGELSRAILVFSSGATAEVEGESEFVLSSQKGPSGLRLLRGAVSVRSSRREAVRVGVMGASVILREQAGYPALCRIASNERAASVTVYSGRVEIQGSRAGLTLARANVVELGVPQGSGQPVGRVETLIPDVLVQHAGDLGEVFLRANELIERDDVIRTKEYGRLRINLFGGSALNVGSLTALRITVRDPENLHTQVELRAGRLRGELAKSAPSGASFEVRTSSAMVNAMGRFLIDAEPGRTTVCVVDGTALLRNARFTIAREMSLHNGQCASIMPDQSHREVEQAAGRIRKELAFTNLRGLPTPAQRKMAAGFRGATIATEAASAVLAGVALNSVGDANNASNSAQSQLSAAADASSAAVTAARAATSAASALCQAVLALQPPPASPSSPPPACQ